VAALDPTSPWRAILSALSSLAGDGLVISALDGSILDEIENQFQEKPVEFRLP
jgi:hypothetical protein